MINIKEKYGLDNDTGRYIASVRKLQICVWTVVVILLFFFARTIMNESEKGMEEVALVEVRKSMHETVHNTKQHIESISLIVQDQAMVDVMDLLQRMDREGVTSLEQVLDYMQVCDENYIGWALEVLYKEQGQDTKYVNAFERDINTIDYHDAKLMFQQAPVGDYIELQDKIIAVFMAQTNLDYAVKEEMRNYLHSEQYEGNQYVWVNEIVDMRGGLNYAIRKIHPNLPELEGEYLSTYEEDAVGNKPYEAELKGIREEGKIFHKYYFKNKLDDEITEKYSYAEYYEPFNWIIATGETLEDVYAHSERISENNMNYLMALMFIVCGMFALTYWFTNKILNAQVYSFRKRIIAQSEILEEMYTTMPVGFVRVRIAPEGVKLLKINPRGLELLGLKNKNINKFNMREHVKYCLSEEETESITNLCWALKEQWESHTAEFHVKGLDGSITIQNVRITLVGIEGDSKILQIIYQDVTDERKRQAMAIIEAEEKASLDSMTQLKNKKAMEEIMISNIASAVETEKNIAVGFVDIDNFRDYNTKYGHLQGDEVIKYVATVLKEHISGDIGRMGGDEFAFCLMNTTYAELEDAMKHVHKCLNEGVFIDEENKNIATPCSIGVVLERGKDLTYESVLEHADMVMYKVKEKGKNSYMIWES